MSLQDQSSVGGRSRDDADPALAARVRAELGDPSAGPMTVLEGGRSGLTYRIDTSRTSYVVKAVPPGRRPVGRNDVLRQADVLAGLAGHGLPVPSVLARQDLEPGWFAMDFAAGEAVEPVLDTSSPIDPELARSRMLAAAALLGALHTVPLAGLGTEMATRGVGLPAPVAPSGEFERWASTMHAVPAELRPGSEDLLAALEARAPASATPVLVHGDFRLGNLLCSGPTPTALIDWEIWSVGDPGVDLSWYGVFTSADLFPGVGRDVGGLPNEIELEDVYWSARSDDGMRWSSRGWFRALGRMKMAAIMGHNLRRHREGRHEDPVQERLPATIAALITHARELLDGEADR